MKTHWIILVAVAVVAAGGGYFLSRALELGQGADAASITVPAAGVPQARQAKDLLGQRRPDFTLRDADGRPVSAEDFDGQVLLLNFWASWCQPCVEEMPMLSELQRTHGGMGVQIVGIALDDPQRAQAFAQGRELGYPLLFGLADAARVGRLYGNSGGMLPYSVLVDAQGIVRWTQLGALAREQVEQRLAELR